MSKFIVGNSNAAKAGIWPDASVAWMLLFVGAVATAGCGLLGEDRQAFEVHLQSSFDQDHVRVELDGRTVFDGRVTTAHVAGLAERIELERPTGTHRIRVTVNDLEAVEKRFKLDERLTVAVQYYAEAWPQQKIPQGVTIKVFEGYVGYF